MTPHRHRRLARLAFILLPLLGGGACSEDADGSAGGYVQRHFSWRRVRILIADAETGRLSLFDAEDEAVISQFTLPAPARVQPSFTGDHAIVATAAGAQFVRTGVSILDHVNHVHVYKDTPRLLEPVFGASATTSVTSNSSLILLNFADPAQSRLLVDEVQPQTSRPVEGTAPTLVLPDGLLQVDGPGVATFETQASAPTTVALPGCDAVVASAAAGGRIAMACTGGFLLGERETWATSFVPDARAGTTKALLVHPSAPGALAHVQDVAGGTLINLVPGAPASAFPLPAGSCHVAHEPAEGDAVVVLSAKGAVHVLSRAGTSLADVKDVLPPFSCEAALRPRLGLAPERAYVLDPRSAELIDVDLRSRRVAKRYPLGDRPVDFAVLGLDPRNAGLRGALPGEI